MEKIKQYILAAKKIKKPVPVVPDAAKILNEISEFLKSLQAKK